VKIVTALRAEGIECGMRGRSKTPDWHVYSYMFPVTMQSGPNGPECVYTCKHYADKGGKISYGARDCPTADDLFDRVIQHRTEPVVDAARLPAHRQRINKVLSATAPG